MLLDLEIVKQIKEDDKLGYRGILYGSFIKCKNGKIGIIEFNARFGDPELQIM